MKQIHTLIYITKVHTPLIVKLRAKQSLPQTKNKICSKNSDYVLESKKMIEQMLKAIHRSVINSIRSKDI